MRLTDLSSSGVIAIVDAGVLRDMAASLTGRWEPSLEDYPERAEELVAAARLRLYGDRARSGWLLIGTKQGIDSATRRGDADWSVGMIPMLEALDDATPASEVDALVRMYRKEEGLDAESARTLATAVLCAPVGLLITRMPRALHHQRDGDLPERLEVIDVFEAVARLEIKPDEAPMVSLPIGSALADLDPWWVPGLPS